MYNDTKQIGEETNHTVRIR